MTSIGSILDHAPHTAWCRIYYQFSKVCSFRKVLLFPQVGQYIYKDSYTDDELIPFSVCGDLDSEMCFSCMFNLLILRMTFKLYRAPDC